MKKLSSYVALAVGVLAATAGAAGAGELNLTISNGRVTLIAHDVTVRQILAEWARIGQTKIVNGEKIIGPPLTLELHDVPEGQALETVLRTAAGYVVAPRQSALRGPSSFDSIVILATSRAPAATAPPPATFVNRATPQVMMPTTVDEDDEAEDATEGGPPPPNVQGSPFPGPAQSNPQGPALPQGPLTSPRPGQLQLPAPQPGNPYVPGQGPVLPTGPVQPSARPGVPRPGGGSGGN